MLVVSVVSCDYQVTGHVTYSPPPWLQFMQDAQEVMDLLVTVQNEQGEMETDDPQVSVPRPLSLPRPHVTSLPLLRRCRT